MKTVAAAIIERNGQVLLARRAANSKYPGHWEFPGGKVENGESLQQCLSRELNEELGIIAIIGTHFCTIGYEYHDGHFKIEAFWTQWEGGTLSLNEHDMVEWVSVDNIESYQLLPADVFIAKMLRRHMQSPIPSSSEYSLSNITSSSCNQPD